MKNEKKSVKDELKNEVEIVEDDSNIKNQTTLLVENSLAETQVPTIKNGPSFFSYILALIIIISFITLLLNATKAKQIKLFKMNDLKSYYNNEHKKYDYEENDYQNLRNF